MNPFLQLLNAPPYVLTSVKSSINPFKDQGNTSTVISSTKKLGFNPFMKADIYSTATRGSNPFLQQKNLPITTAEYPNPFLRLLNSPPYSSTLGNPFTDLITPLTPAPAPSKSDGDLRHQLENWQPFLNPSIVNDADMMDNTSRPLKRKRDCEGSSRSIRRKLNSGSALIL